MGSTVAGVIVVAVLGGWHLHTRRHRNWRRSADGRFYTLLGYPLLAIAAFWLVQSPTNTDWEWALGTGWALSAMVCFTLGFNALNTMAAPPPAPETSVQALTATSPQA